MTSDPPPPSGPPVPPRRTSSLAIAALVTALLGVCVPCVGPLAAAVLGVLALVKLRGGLLGGAPLAIVALVIAAFVAVTHVGLVAAVAVPSFLSFQARAKQAECKSNLQALHAAQVAYFAQHNRYSEDAAALGFSPSTPQRYSYFLSADQRGWLLGGEGAPQRPEVEGVQLGVTGECPDCSYAAACQGEIDGDGDWDVWVISSAAIVLATGAVIAAGELHNLVPDIDVHASRSGGSYSRGSSFDDDD